MGEGGGGQGKIIKCQHYWILKRKQYIILDPVQIGRFSLQVRGRGWWNTWKIRSDTNVLNKYSRVIDDAVKLIHTHSKYKAIKVHVNIRYYKYIFTQTEITK